MERGFYTYMFGHSISVEIKEFPHYNPFLVWKDLVFASVEYRVHFYDVLTPHYQSYPGYNEPWYSRPIDEF